MIPSIMTGPTRTALLPPTRVLALLLAALPFCSTLSAQAVLGAETAAAAGTASVADGPAYSSSLPAASGMQPVPLTMTAGAAPPAPAPLPDRGTRPFSAFAVAVKAGFAGVGFDVATPLSQRFNLRGGASFFQYNGSYNVDGTTVGGEVKFQTVAMSLDWFPFNNRFRISPGVILHNGNSLNASANVPGGQSFTLEDTTYTSSTTDPVHGSAGLLFGNKSAPSLTVGTGNMIPRHGGHFSVPFEIGFEYITSPTFQLNLQGTACSQGICQSTSNAQFQANLQAEQNEINSDIAPLRVYPILSIGLGYKF